MLEGMGNRPSGDPEARAKDIFSMIDTNDDGNLTEEEFIKGSFHSNLKETHTTICAGVQQDEEMIQLLTKLFETLLEVRVNLHGVLTKLKLKYAKK